MSSTSKVAAPDEEENQLETPKAEPFKDPFISSSNIKTVEENDKSNSSTRSTSPVLKSETENSTDFQANSLKQLNEKLNDEGLPQLSMKNGEEEDESKENDDDDDDEETDDMDSYFKNAQTSSALTNTGDVSLNLNITNTEEILPTLNEIEDLPSSSNLLNQFDVALRSGGQQNYDVKINIESLDVQIEGNDDDDVDKNVENNDDETENTTATTTTTTTTTTTATSNNINNSTISADDSNLVSLLN